MHWLQDPGGEASPIDGAQLWRRVRDSAAEGLVPRRWSFLRRPPHDGRERADPSPVAFGPLQQGLLDALQMALLPEGSPAHGAVLIRPSGVAETLASIDRLTFEALCAARQASSYLQQRVDPIFAVDYTVMGESSDEPDYKTQEVHAVDALRACPGGPDYLAWALDIAATLRGRHATALRNLIEEEAELRLQRQRLALEFDTDLHVDYAIEELDDQGEWILLFDQVGWRAAREAAEFGPCRATWEAALHDGNVAQAASNVRQAFDARPAPGLGWPWHGPYGVDGYMPDAAAGRPSWPFACALRPQDRRSATTLSREGDARWQLGSVLAATGGHWLATRDPQAQAAWAVVRDAGSTLQTAGTALRLLARAQDLRVGTRSRCAVCSRHIRRTGLCGRMHCPLHVTASAAEGQHKGERTDAYRLYGWGRRRRERWHTLAADLRQNSTIVLALDDLAAWWEDPDRMSDGTLVVDAQRVAELLDRLQPWFGETVHRRLRRLLPIWYRLAVAIDPNQLGWRHPITLFAMHFAGTARLRRAGVDASGKAGPSNPAGAGLRFDDVAAPTDASHPLALGVASREGFRLSELVEYSRAEVLCDLLAQRAWIECGGAAMDDERSRSGSTGVPAPPPLARAGVIDKEVAREMLASGRTKKEIAEAFGVTRSAVTQFFQRIERLLASSQEGPRDPSVDAGRSDY